MKLHSLRKTGVAVGNALGLTRRETEEAIDAAAKVSSLLNNVDKPQEFIDYVSDELRKRGITGDIAIEVISAAAGRKDVKYAFEPLECVRNRDAIKVFVQHGSPIQAFYTMINPMDMGVDVVCQMLGLPVPEEWPADDRDEETPLDEICKDCEQLWRRDEPQRLVVTHLVLASEGLDCTKDELEVSLELAYEKLLVGSAKLASRCKYVATQVLKETSVIVEDEQGNFSLDRRGRKHILNLARALLVGSTTAGTIVNGDAVKQLREFVQAQKGLSSLSGDKSRLEDELARAETQLELARQTLTQREEAVANYRRQLGEISAGIETAQMSGIDSAAHPILRHLDENQIASLCRG